MTEKIKCTHCEKYANREYYIENYGLCEEEIECECGYYYKFAYGNYREQIPGKEMMWWDWQDKTRKPCMEEFL